MHKGGSRMFSFLRRHLSYANVVATMALVFAMGGSAVAASHYLINSTNQVNPKVLAKLKGKTGARGPQGATGSPGPVQIDPGAVSIPIGPQGKEGPPGKEGQPGSPSAVVARVRSAKSVQTLTGTKVEDSMTGGSWSQGANEADQFIGTVTATTPSKA